MVVASGVVDAVVPALAGALAGGAAGVVGSFLVNRYELTRRHRVELLTDLLPSLMNELEKVGETNYVVVIDLAQRVSQHALVARGLTRRDRRFSDEINRERLGAVFANAAIVEPTRARNPAAVEETNIKARAELEDHLEELYATARRYLAWLRDRF